MPQAFFSHNFKDKKIVLQVLQKSKSSLIKTWIDEEQTHVGASLMQMISGGISKSTYFFMFVSNDYLTSKWCLEELDQAYSYCMENKLTIIPILLTPRKDLAFDSLPNEKRTVVESLLKRVKYVEFDAYRIEESLQRTVDALWQHEPIRFEPVRAETIAGTKLQIINFKNQAGDLPTDFLKHWDFNILEFVADSQGEDKPIQPRLPVAFNGPAPNWIYTYLTIPLKNRRTVYVFNTRTDEFICVYALEQDGHYSGRVLKQEQG